MSLRWFEAQYNTSRCVCGHRITKGDLIAYADDKGAIMRHECCGEPFDQIGLFDSLSDPNPNAGSTRRKVMPTGKTSKDKCPRCFLIHSKAQGDECE